MGAHERIQTDGKSGTSTTPKADKKREKPFIEGRTWFPAKPEKIGEKQTKRKGKLFLCTNNGKAKGNEG